MRIELIVIDGGGVRAGRLADWLDRQLAGRGLRLDRWAVLRPEAAGRLDAANEAAARADLVVAAGLRAPARPGPARFFEAPLAFDDFRAHCERNLFSLLDAADVRSGVAGVPTEALPLPTGERQAVDRGGGASRKARAQPLPGAPGEADETAREALEPCDDQRVLPAAVLARRLGDICRARHATLAVAESCTGGLIGAALTEVPGSSAYFVGGAVTYANAEKTRALGVPEELIARHGAVSEATARAMAEGARLRIGTSFAVSVTGIAGPGGGSPRKPVGTVFVAVAGPKRTQVQRFRFAGGRADVRAASVAQALELLVEEIEAGS